VTRLMIFSIIRSFQHQHVFTKILKEGSNLEKIENFLFCIVLWDLRCKV